MKSFFTCLPLLALSVIASPVANIAKRDSVTVHFIETVTTYFGEVCHLLLCSKHFILTSIIQNIFVVGGIDELGNWSPDNAVRYSPYILIEFSIDPSLLSRLL